MAAAASYFSGTALMPSQRSGAPAPEYSAAGTGAAAAPSPSKPRDPRFSGCVPATVLHISRSFAAALAADGGGDPVFSIDGVETTNVRVLGRVVSVVSRDTDVCFTLDDSTGKIPLVRWITDQSDTRDTSYIQEGVYVKVQVNLMGFQAKKQGLARSIRPINNFNEVVLHFIECMHVHLESVQSKMQRQLPPSVQTNEYTHVPSSGGVRDYQVHFTPQVNQGLPPAVQTNTSTYVPLLGGVRDHQAHFAQVNQGQFSPAVQANTSTHLPFSGGVGEHQIHFTPKLTQALVDYSMTHKEWFWKLCSNQIYLLSNMEHTLMNWGVVKHLAAAGFVYWTIDDNHVKSMHTPRHAQQLPESREDKNTPAALHKFTIHLNNCHNH
uniref:OB domain-containing protein n=1 Tax=Oryza glumipatula TaxID=40148 RepID=A0A0E0ADP7_9ORYZ